MGLTPEAVLFPEKPASIVVTLKDDTQIAVKWDEACPSYKTKIRGVPGERWQISEKALATSFSMVEHDFRRPRNVAQASDIQF